jgi:hypothetical protein
MNVYLKNLAGDIERVPMSRTDIGEELYERVDRKARLFRGEQALNLNDILQPEEVINVFYVDRNPLILVEISKEDTKYDVTIKACTKFLEGVLYDTESAFTFYHSHPDSFYYNLRSPSFTTKEDFFRNHAKDDYLLYKMLVEEWDCKIHWENYLENYPWSEDDDSESDDE